ncbi:MAG: hypothetical protein LC659_15340, partial [Myxococcales bacterium]|nr:hypothetical protein [Myxococcales bacterium]
MKHAAALLVMLAAPPCAATASTVPAGVEIPVALVGAVSSASVKPGDAFHFKTTADVRAGDVTIVAGTAGTGKIADAASGGH